MVPHGINIPQACRSKRRCGTHADGKPFVFLFDSGFLWRKGVDLLVEAYLAEFRKEDNVVLLLHAIYGQWAVGQFSRHGFSSVHAGSQSLCTNFSGAL